MANKPIVGNVTVGGTAKTISDGYVCIGGVWKPIVETYVNIGGVWKPAWERGYTWKKYNTVTTTTDGWTWGNNITITGDGYMSFTNNTSTSSLSPVYSGGTLKSLGYTGTYDQAGTGMDRYTPSSIENRLRNGKLYIPNVFRLYYFANYPWTATGYTINYDYHYYFVSYTYDDIFGVITMTCKPPVYSGKTTYSQGSYIADVTAETENAYPANGRHTDGYWYVFQG